MNSGTPNESDDDYEIEIPLYYKKQIGIQKDTPEIINANKPQLIQNILASSSVSSALDRLNMSDRKFAMLAAAIAKANGQDLSEVTLSRSTIRRKRLYNRSNIVSDIRERFQTHTKSHLVVHWDGKIMKDTTGSDKVSCSITERLAVVVTGFQVEKILGLVKIPSGTGQSQAKAIFELLTLWEVSENIVGISFDTTPSNTGHASGACVMLESLLNRNLLHFACRHHIHELIISDIFVILFGPTRGPNIGLFERFRKVWYSIDQSKFNPLDDVRRSDPLLQDMKHIAASNLTRFLSGESSYMPREDYREICELCLIVLGFEVPNKPLYHFRAPGAYHMARWMAKVIYCFKIYLFREQFKLTENERKGLAEFCLFASHIYVAAWVVCPIPADAPINDLSLVKAIIKFSKINDTISRAAMRKLQNHLWYLGPEMVPLALFSSKVESQEKRRMVQAMILCGSDWSIRGKKYAVDEVSGLERIDLHDLIKPSSNAALQLLGLDISLLAGTEPDDWINLPSYERAATVVQSLKVVNDCAERSIALMSAFNQSLTKTESEMQRLIQVVEDHRHRIPNMSKKTLEKCFKLSNL